MQLHQLLYLKTVAETRSIRKASEKLFVSQQAISQSLQKLEEEYDIQLLNRSVHGVTLTEAGSYAASVAEQILLLSNNLETYFVSQAQKQESGQLRIAAINSIKNFVLPDTQFQFAKQYPNIQLFMDSLGTKQVIEAVASKDCQLGFFGNPYIDDKPMFQIEPPLHFVGLSRYEYCVAISENSPLNNYNTLSVNSILNYPIIFLKEQLQDTLEEYMPYRILSHYGNVNALIADSIRYMGKLVDANMGIAIATDGIFVSGETVQGVVKPLRDNIYGYFGYLIHEDAFDNPIVNDFLEILQHTVPINA